ncbi:hypothetical protein [Alistipes sp.]|uniref:hypothetical protein n=1 Tax=Alistipes sp. TaxID=1872444 RepID=UPI003AEF4CFA
MKTSLLILTLLTFASCGGQGEQKHASVENDRAAAGASAETVTPSAADSNTGDQRPLPKTDSPEATNDKDSCESRYTIKTGGAGIFSIGQPIPAQAEGYTITKGIETRWEEGEEFDIPIYTISEKGERLLNLEPFYDDKAGQYSEIIGDIYILSEKFRTTEGIGLESTLEAFTAAYPDFKIWYSYVSDIYVIETDRLDNIQFLLDGHDFLQEGGPDFDSDRTILQPSEFKKGSKIKAIRIFGYVDDYL